jgi:hypothetical protein
MRSISKRVYSENKRERNSKVAQTLGRAQQAPEGEALPVRNVDAEFLRESRWEKLTYQTKT